MQRFIIIVWQSLFILFIGSLIGLGVNAISDPSLPLIRKPLPPAEELWTVISAEEVEQRVNEGTAIVVDARDPNEYEIGHIPGSLNLPAKDFMQAFTEVGEALPRDFAMIVYCQGGACDQSHEVLEQLEVYGFQELLLYQDGWEDWKSRGLPTEP